MRILYILPTLNSGGAELRAIERINILSKRPEVLVKLVVLSDQIELINNVDRLVEIEVLNFKEMRVLTAKAFVASFFYCKNLRNVIVKSNPDVIIASLPMSHHLARLALLLRKKDFKLFQYHHAPQYIENPIKKPSQYLLYFLTRFLSSRVDDGHIFISEAVKRNIDSHLSIKNGHVLYNAVKDNYKLALNKQSSLNSEDFNIVIPGRLTPVKGHIPALQVCAKFISEYPKVKVWIIGEGSERDEIKKFIKTNNLETNIFLMGNIENVNLLRYLYDSNVVLIPSLSEGLGNVAIEALMMGATVVASDVGGLKEVINSKDIGILYQKNNPDDLFNILEKIYSQKIIFSKEDIRNSYLHRFTIERHINKFLKIIS